MIMFWGAVPRKIAGSLLYSQYREFANQASVTSFYYIYKTETQDVETLSYIKNFG